MRVLYLALLILGLGSQTLANQDQPAAGGKNGNHQLQTISNKNVKGTVVAITNKEVRMIDGEGKEVKTPLDQVIAINLRAVSELPADAKYSIVQLFDSQLYCKKIAYKKGNTIDVTLVSEQQLSLPLTDVISILNNGQEKALRTEWQKFLTKSVKTDRLLYRTEKGALDELDGSFGDVVADGAKIQFQIGGKGEVKELPVEKLAGLIYYHPKTPAKSAACYVYDVMGNKMGATEVGVDGDNFIVTAPSGAKLTFAERSLAKIDYNLGKLVFLSDLQPTDVVEESGIGLEIGMKYRKDSNLDGDRILLGKDDYVKGLTLHAHTELEYNLDSKYKDFKAVLGVDARAKTESKATVIIECDGNKVFKQTIHAQKQVPISLNVRNVLKLRIIVTSDDLLQLHDQATLAEARISQ
jgi:hypothetical protein